MCDDPNGEDRRNAYPLHAASFAIRLKSFAKYFAH